VRLYLSNSFQLSLTRKELAEFAGCSTENIISSEAKYFEISDIEKLKYISKIR